MKTYQVLFAFFLLSVGFVHSEDFDSVAIYPAIHEHHEEEAVIVADAFENGMTAEILRIISPLIKFYVPTAFITKVDNYATLSESTYKAAALYETRHPGDPALRCIRCNRRLNVESFFAILEILGIKKLLSGTYSFAEISAVFTHFSTLLAAEVAAYISAFMLDTVESETFYYVCPHCHTPTWTDPYYEAEDTADDENQASAHEVLG